MALLLESIMTYTSVLFVIPSGCFFVGSCFLITFFVNDIAANVPRLNFIERSDDENQELNEHFRNIIQDFADAKQLSTINECSVISINFPIIH